MAGLMRSGHGGSWLPSLGEEWHLPSLRRRPAHRDPSTGLLIAGVAAVGLAYLAWVYIGPDLRRYLKVHSM